MGLNHKVCRCVVAGCLVWGTAFGAGQADWPQFRGANQDGISKETPWNPQALAAGPKVLWTAEVGAGYSSVSVVGDRLFTSGNKNNQDTLFALSPKTGQVIWQHSYPCPAGSYPGPRATPASDGTLVYALSREGLLLCLDAKSGAVKWEKQLMREFGSQNLRWGFSGSPIIAGDKLLINAGENGIVLNRNTGAKLWASSGGVGGYAAPVGFKQGKTDCIAVFGSKALYIVELATGKRLADYPWETSYDINAADPIIQGSRIFVSSGYGKGCAVLDISGPALREVWFNKTMKNQFSSCVLIDGFLYGFDGQAGNGSLKCLDFSTGEEKWSERIGFGSLSAVGDQLVALNEQGDVFVVKASPAGYNLVASAKKVLDKTCWTAPVMCRGVLYCRNDKGRLVALDVGK